MQESCESNYEEILKKYIIPNNVLLYAIVGMKSERPSVGFKDIHKEVSVIFKPKRVIGRLFGELLLLE